MLIHSAAIVLLVVRSTWHEDQASHHNPLNHNIKTHFRDSQNRRAWCSSTTAVPKCRNLGTSTHVIYRLGLLFLVHFLGVLYLNNEQSHIRLCDEKVD
ncbi:hypothetical protein F5Y06DRAFT_58116 [Hypoxylon sp. FL0890]|nr:hypothetical protein F5Y06DRAFT_58116 [Hypoxylon sp. FL0890]